MVVFSLEQIEDEETFEEDLIEKFVKEFPKHEVLYCADPPKDSIPIGSVDWCEKVYGHFTPDYYPKILKDTFNRNIYLDDYKNVKNKKIFIKPALKYKTWNGHINELNEDIDELVWCSDIIEIENEWRYYIANGECFASVWYDGVITDKEIISGIKPPDPIDLSNSNTVNLLDILKENNYYGVVDFCMTKQNKFTLVEAHHPYAFGWYTDDYITYGKYLIECDKYLKLINNTICN